MAGTVSQNADCRCTNQLHVYTDLVQSQSRRDASFLKGFLHWTTHSNEEYCKLLSRDVSRGYLGNDKENWGNCHCEVSDLKQEHSRGNDQGHGGNCLCEVSDLKLEYFKGTKAMTKRHGGNCSVKYQTWNWCTKAMTKGMEIIVTVKYQAWNWNISRALRQWPGGMEAIASVKYQTWNWCIKAMTKIVEAIVTVKYQAWNWKLEHSRGNDQGHGGNDQGHGGNCLCEVINLKLVHQCNDLGHGGIFLVASVK